MDNATICITVKLSTYDVEGWCIVTGSTPEVNTLDIGRDGRNLVLSVCVKWCLVVQSLWEYDDNLVVLGICHDVVDVIILRKSDDLIALWECFVSLEAVSTAYYIAIPELHLI